MQFFSTVVEEGYPNRKGQLFILDVLVFIKIVIRIFILWNHWQNSDILNGYSKVWVTSILFDIISRELWNIPI